MSTQRRQLMAFIFCQIDPGSVAYLDGRLTLWDEVLKVCDC